MAFPFRTPTPRPPQSQRSLFQTPRQQSPLFQNPQTQQQQHFQQSPVQFQRPQTQLRRQQQATRTAPQMQLLLFTKDKTPAGYNTNWEDLHPASQKFLLQIEVCILKYKDESQRLDQCSRLYDSSVSGDSFEANSSRIIQELGLITTTMEREKNSVQDLIASANKLIWDTEFAIRSYMMLRSRFIRQSVTAASNVASGNPNTGLGLVSKQTNQLANSSTAPVFDFYSGIPKRPSIFMEQTITKFEKYLSECYQWIEEVQQLVMMENGRRGSNALESLPQVMSNVHDFFIHVAAKVESLHQYVESMKIAYLADQRCRGDANDPFLEANRRETAKREAAARRVHPTLYLPTVSSQPTGGAFNSSVAPATSTMQPSIVPSAASYGSGLSLFSTPSAPAASSPSEHSLFITPSSALAASSSFLFSTPTASAPASNLFDSSGFSPHSTSFVTPAPLFGSIQASSGFATSTPAVGSTPGVGSSLFSTPLSAAGAATDPGVSVGLSKSSRPRSRTSRR